MPDGIQRRMIVQAQIINVVFLYYPPLGTARSDVLTYLRDHDGRLLSVLAGLLACFGDMAQFLAGQAVGYAVRPPAEAVH